MKVALVLVVCLLAGECCAHGHEHGHSHNEAPAFKYSRQANEHRHPEAPHGAPHSPLKPVAREVWFEAIVSTLVISAAPILMLYVIPLDNTAENAPLLKVLLAFASGGLLGDAFLHLIPHAMMAAEGDEEEGAHSHSHGHEGHEHGSHNMTVGIAVLGGIFAFLIIEKCMRLMKGGGHSHSHAHVPVEGKAKAKRHRSRDSNSSVVTSEDESRATIKRSSKKSKSATRHRRPHGASSHDIKPAGLLNLAADFCHNFTDGLAIGASYLAGRGIGIVTTITILLHEVPHELGDFAILLQSGVSRRGAILLQLTTAVGALAGTALSLLAQDGAFGFLASKWVLPFTAGGFIYISLVSIIPELLNDDKSTVKEACCQIVALLTGIYMMVLIAQYE